jgi:tRNA pseudouridine38-40 synthase
VSDPGSKEAEIPLRHFAVKLEYEGSRFLGWQRQGPGRTVQGEIEGALARILGARVPVHASGRTDSGVHALGQVASFRAATRLSTREIARGLNGLLPEDVAVLECRETDAAFHARFSAVSKTYRYRILNRSGRTAVDRAFCWRVPVPLDLERMREAAKDLVGRLDFRAFCAEAAARKSTVRTVLRLDIEKSGDYILVTIEADGFLYNMVRAIVGTLVLVGSGKMSLETFRDVLRSRDRRRAGPTAPARGLFLAEVRYR